LTPRSTSQRYCTSRFARHRPHRAVARRTPAQAYAARPKATPHGLVIDPHWRVRQDRIDRTGCVTIRHNSRLHHIGLGRRLAGTRITLPIADLDIRIINRDTGHLIRALHLDTNRRRLSFRAAWYEVRRPTSFRRSLLRIWLVLRRLP
jgi:hypothetical protein